MPRIAFDMLDPMVQRAVRKEERASGLRYGPQMLKLQDGRFVQCFVSITFYPDVRWWIEGEQIERRPLGDGDRPNLVEIKV